jgi:ketosteroid isomerase-like protein
MARTGSKRVTPAAARVERAPEARPTTNVARARDYIAALARGASREQLARFLAPNIAQEEFSNRIAPQGVRRNLVQMLESFERSKQLLASQTFEIRNAFGAGAFVVLEVDWRGKLAVSAGGIPAGASFHANLSVILEFLAGRIVAQRNYDCYDPF